MYLKFVILNKMYKTNREFILDKILFSFSILKLKLFMNSF